MNANKHTQSEKRLLWCLWIFLLLIGIAVFIFFLYALTLMAGFMKLLVTIGGICWAYDWFIGKKGILTNIKPWQL